MASWPKILKNLNAEGNMRVINDIIIHCSANKADSKIKAADIDSEHRRRGFKGIGYHYVILPDGTIELGRPPSKAGAHCIGHNAHSIGICYVGGLGPDGRPADTRTDAQKTQLRILITHLTYMYRCPTHGHRDYTASKACPCFDAYNEYKNILQTIQAAIK